MRNKVFWTVILILAGFASGLSLHATDASPFGEDVSGSLVDGYRILPIAPIPDGEIVSLTVYRGDYIKFDIDDSISDTVLNLPALSIRQPLPRKPAEAPYFKMKSTGVFPFTLGQVSGTIAVIDYKKTNYREVSSKEAFDLILNTQTLVLDVRTDAEFNSGHLEDAVLIPVQQLQARLNELSAYKDQPILVYCATGNRSTVASKIMIDSGFKRIHNMRYGIYQWSRDSYPVVR